MRRCGFGRPATYHYVRLRQIKLHENSVPYTGRMLLDPKLHDPAFCHRKAGEYSDKARTTTNADLKDAYEALAREYDRRVRHLRANRPEREQDKVHRSV